MRKYVLFVLCFVGLVGLVNCSRAVPDAGTEAVLIKKPMFFGHGGVVPEPVTTGSEWCVFTTDICYIPMTPFQARECFDDLITDDNNPVDFDVYIELQVEKGRSPYLLDKFQTKWYENNISPTVRKLVRDKASQYKTFDLAGNREVLASIESHVEEGVRTLIVEKGIPVTCNRVVMGKVTPPAAVMEETNKTAAQIQAKRTQDARTEAERARANAEKAKAEADEAYKRTMSMSVSEYLYLRKLEIEKEKVEMLRDKNNITVFLSESPSGIVPTYPVK